MLTDASDLQNLAYCARQCMSSLTADQMIMVATAIKHAEADITEMRKTVTMAEASAPAVTDEVAPVEAVRTDPLAGEAL